MIWKTVFMLSVFFIPLIIINAGLVGSVWLLFTLYIISGIGMAGIGMGVMHDAIHGAYSQNRTVNKYMGYTMNLIGANSNMWKIQHNVLHHTYTNITEADHDIKTPFFLRFSPHTKKYWIHRFQHFYVWFFYGLSTLSWVTVKDFIQVKMYKKMGFFKTRKEFTKEIFKISGWKVLYYGYSLVLPMIMLPFAPWIIILAFLCMHFFVGVAISIIFQTAHVMPSSEFPKPDENGLIANDWAIHQLATTSNFSPKSRIFSWMIGGLNYQIEHHLLPNICHVHYRELSRIVSETAKEYGIPYNTRKTFVVAVWDHIKMLRQLGTMELAPVKQQSNQ
ncbi:MAG: fatty acid desaturase family protein [Candidatus Cyclobacteriaceae bacterium M2_1C_046]